MDGTGTLGNVASLQEQAMKYSLSLTVWSRQPDGLFQAIWFSVSASRSGPKPRVPHGRPSHHLSSLHFLLFLAGRSQFAEANLGQSWQWAAHYSSFLHPHHGEIRMLSQLLPLVQQRQIEPSCIPKHFDVSVPLPPLWTCSLISFVHLLKNNTSSPWRKDGYTVQNAKHS